MGNGCKDRINLRYEKRGVLNAVNPAWERVSLTVDSGASETVIGEEMVASAELKEGPAARQGVQYEVANGVRIPNLGEKSWSLRSQV